MSWVRRLRSSAGLGFLHGALVVGAPISLLHVLHNRLTSVGDALVLLAVMSVLYGCLSALAFVLCAVPRVVLRPPPSRPADFAVGLFGFHAVFWVVVYEHGLTYDQVPLVTPTSARGMILFLVAATAVIVVAVALATALLSRVAVRLAARGVAGRVVLAGWAVMVLLHVTLPLARARAQANAVVESHPDTAAIVPEARGAKVVLIGVDGADWRAIEPLMARGALPGFAALVRDGSSGALATLADANSAVIWASAYTGQNPSRHEVQDFYTIHLPGMRGRGIFPVHRTFFKELAGYLEPFGLATRQTISRESLAVHPIWEILDRVGLSIGVVDGYYFSYPAPAPRDPASFFLAYGLDAFAAGLAATAGDAPPGVERFAQPPSLYPAIRPLLAGGDLYWQSAALLQLLAQAPQPRFVSLYTHQPDSVQHAYWKWFQPELYLGVEAAELDAHADAIPAVYRDLDAFLGRLRGVLDPDTVLMVFSDHGQAPTILHRTYTQHRHGPPGVLLMQGGPVRRGARLRRAHVTDVVPTVLYLLGLPVPRDAAGRVLTEALDPAFVLRQPPRRVSSYELLWSGETREPRGTFEEERSRQEIEKLRALGYVR